MITYEGIVDTEWVVFDFFTLCLSGVEEQFKLKLKHGDNVRLIAQSTPALGFKLALLDYNHDLCINDYVYDLTHSTQRMVHATFNHKHFYVKIELC